MLSIILTIDIIIYKYTLTAKINGVSENALHFIAISNILT